jgi:hypothetical protein
VNKRTLYKRVLVGVLALGVMTTTIYGFTRRPDLARAATPDPTPVPNVNGDSICVIHSTQCLDLQGNEYVANNPIVFYGFNATEERFRWHLDLLGHVSYHAASNTGAPFSDPSFDQYYNNDPIYYLEKSTLTGHDGCIGTIPSVGDVAWQSCGAPTTRWVRHNQYFVNVWWTNDSDARVVLSLLQHASLPACTDSNNDQAQVYLSSNSGCNVQFEVGLHEG